MMTTFLDVPVYRLPLNEYDRQQKAYIEKTLDDPILRDNAAFRQHLWERYGGCWLFNEIIGYIRLHFLGSQVRGEYFAVNRKRIVRTRNRQLGYMTHKLAPEVDIEMPVTDATIEAAVRQYLQACQRQVPRRHVDLSLFEVLAPHIRWYDLWATTNPFSSAHRGAEVPNPSDRRWPRRRRRPGFADVMRDVKD
jgi:hypothetical protein